MTSLPPKLLAAFPVGSMPADPVATLLDLMRAGQRFLVCSHYRPDGDAVGSMLATGMLLAALGKQADLVTADPIPALYRTLPGAGAIRWAAHISGDYDAVILLECDSFARPHIEGLDPYFHINIDHHATGTPFGNVNWIVPEAAAVGELVFRLIMAAGVPLTRDMAVCLYTAILTDTGGFSHGKTSAETFAIAEQLARAGADPVIIAREIYATTSSARLRILGAALSTIQHEGNLAWLWVTNHDMARTGATDEDLEGIVNYAICIAGVQAAAFLRELPDSAIRVSLRSVKGGLNVAAIAVTLGGGGHENAAGVTLDGPLSRAIDHTIEVLRAALA